MTAARQHLPDCRERRSFAIEAFAIRSWARAALVTAGPMDFHDAVGSLQETAVEHGRVEQIGQDEVQAAIAVAFAGDLQHDVEPAIEMTMHGKQPHRIVARDGVASAAELQRDYERASRQERIDHGLAASTGDALKYVIAQRDPERLRRFMAGRSRDELAAMRRLMGGK
jgi:hypothetical protein